MVPILGQVAQISSSSSSHVVPKQGRVLFAVGALSRDVDDKGGHAVQKLELSPGRGRFKGQEDGAVGQGPVLGVADLRAAGVFVVVRVGENRHKEILVFGGSNQIGGGFKKDQ